MTSATHYAKQDRVKAELARAGESICAASAGGTFAGVMLTGAWPLTGSVAAGTLALFAIAFSALRDRYAKRAAQYTVWNEAYAAAEAHILAHPTRTVPQRPTHEVLPSELGRELTQLSEDIESGAKFASSAISRITDLLEGFTALNAHYGELTDERNALRTERDELRTTLMQIRGIAQKQATLNDPEPLGPPPAFLRPTTEPSVGPTDLDELETLLNVKPASELEH